MNYSDSKQYALSSCKSKKLNQLTQIPNLLIADSKDAQSYDPDKVRNAISILEGELSKLEELDMVLAVVGTMKAGKSTTNNAIVGSRGTRPTAAPDDRLANSHPSMRRVNQSHV